MNETRAHAREWGFTLIELLVVMSIVSVLASLVLVSLTNARTKAATGASIEFATTLDHSATTVGKWDMDECAGSTAADGSNNRYTMATSGGVGTPVWSTDTSLGTGCALQFDGASYVMQNNSVPNFTQKDFTISLWIKRADANCVISDNSSGVRIFGDGQSVLIDQSTNTYNYTNPSVTCAIGAWCQVAITLKYTGGVGSAVEYVNGKKVSSIGGILPLRITSGFVIGGASSSYQLFTGSIDNVRIYDTALLSSDIGRMYAESAPAHGIALR